MKRFQLPTVQGDFLKRIVTGALLIADLVIAMYFGVPLIFLNILFIQVKSFDEVLQIAYKMKRIPDVAHFRMIHWYLLLTANYFFTGYYFFEHMEVFHKRYQFVNFLNLYHYFISFCLYLIAMIWFLTLLREKSMRQQFSLLFWTHFLFIIIVGQSYMAVGNMFEGLIWVFLPLSLVILNDIFSYFFGRLIGRTPLIHLSPKKTWEGFIMGGISTIIFGSLLGYFFSKIHYVICPIEYKEINGRIVPHTDCTPSYVFQLQEYRLFNTGYTVYLYPSIIHTLVFSIFASIIAPFGGFFASGFKRAAGVKDFGNVIPGHGGIMDRFDCQFLMATFINIYLRTFIKSPNLEKVFQRILLMDDDKQLEFFYLLEKYLKGYSLQ